MNAPGQGRKPKPTHLRLLDGNAGKRPINKNEPIPVGDLVDAPDGFSDEQKAEWRYALENAPAGLLRRLDRKIFGEWCIASVDLTEAELALRTEGKVVKKGGDQRITVNAAGEKTTTVRSVSMVKNPWVTIRRDAFDRLMKATADLGFSPTSRARLSAPAAGKTNKFANNAAKARA